jgi:hypothetical protein
MSDDPELEPTLARLTQVARTDPRSAGILALHLDRSWAGAVFLYSGRRRHELRKFIDAAELSERELEQAELYASVRTKLEGSAIAVANTSALMAPASAAPSYDDGSRVSASAVFGSLIVLAVAMTVDPHFGFALFFFPVFALRRLFWRRRSDADVPPEAPENRVITGPGFDERRALIEGAEGRKVAALVEAHPALAYDAFPHSDSPFR